MTFSNKLSQRRTVCYERLDCFGDNRSNNVLINGCFPFEKERVRTAHSTDQEMGKGILRACGCGDCLGLGFFVWFLVVWIFLLFFLTFYDEKAKRKDARLLKVNLTVELEMQYPG